jgi:hypothetical protein
MYFLRYKVIGLERNKKILKNGPVSCLGLDTCHQKPNPSRETVPLKQEAL